MKIIIHVKKSRHTYCSFSAKIWIPFMCYSYNWIDPAFLTPGTMIEPPYEKWGVGQVRHILYCIYIYYIYILGLELKPIPNLTKFWSESDNFSVVFHRVPRFDQCPQIDRNSSKIYHFSSCLKHRDDQDMKKSFPIEIIIFFNLRWGFGCRHEITTDYT